MFEAITYTSDFPAFPGGDRVATFSEISSRGLSGESDIRSTSLIAQLQQQQKQENQQQLDSESPSAQNGEYRNRHRARYSLSIVSSLSQPSGSTLQQHQRSYSELYQKSQLNDADDLTDSSPVHRNSVCLISTKNLTPTPINPLTFITSTPTTTPAAAAQQLPAAKDSVVLSNVAVNDPKLRPALAAMLPQIRALSIECFQEDVVLQVTKKSGWKMNLLVTPDESRLLGFLSYRVHGESNSLVEVSRVAICADCRRCGYGHHIMKDVLATAKKLPAVQYVTLSSLVETVKFYQNLGFHKHEDIKFVYTATNANEELVENQVYMEKKIRNSQKKKAGKQKTGGKRR